MMHGQKNFKLISNIFVIDKRLIDLCVK